MPTKPTPTSLPKAPLLLAFGAHPDDIEFGCGGVIAGEAATGRRIHFVVCSRGEAASNGTPAQRVNVQLLGEGYAIEWPDLDEHIGMKGLLAGRRSGESPASFKRWLANKKN